MSLARRMAALVLAGGWLLAGAAAAQPAAGAAPADPAAAPVGDPALRDPVFRVHGTGLGLERRVEMYQWVPGDAGFALEWRDAPVDSGAADEAHRNAAFPLESERWLPRAITVDGHPLDPDAVQALASWREFRPAFDALPGNLLATFQPEGDGLGSAENPLDPQPGDLRIRWRERVLPPLADRIELRDGRWMLRPDAPLHESAQPPSRAWAFGLLPVVLGGLALLVLAVVLARRRR